MSGSELKTRALRVVTGAWLFGWFCKINFYAPYLLNVTREHPIIHDLFPPVFLNNNISLIFYLLPSVTILTFFINKRFLFRLCAVIMIVSTVVLNLHINTYNDATFVTSFWVALWICWFSFQSRGGGFHACMLAQLIVALVFLGGFVGKLTPEYLNGEVVYQIFFEQAVDSPVNLFLDAASDDQKMRVAAFISKMIIAGEFLLAVNILMPAFLAFILALVIMPVLMLFSTWKILSVLSSLIGLCVAGIILSKRISVTSAQ